MVGKRTPQRVRASQASGCLSFPAPGSCRGLSQTLQFSTPEPSGRMREGSAFLGWPARPWPSDGPVIDDSWSWVRAACGSAAHKDTLARTLSNLLKKIKTF